MTHDKNFTHKSTPAEIEARFDGDVARFSNLETGQSATIDAPLVLDLITDAAAYLNPNPDHILDIGCGAGNYTLKLLEKVETCQSITLVDLSLPMLKKAKERIMAVSSVTVQMIQGDIREIDLDHETYDTVLAAAVLHHLRDDLDWETQFEKIFQCLRPKGSFWISDLVTHHHPPIHDLMWKRYGEYLSDLKNDAYRDEVFDYIDQEDSPRSLIYQLQLLQKVGFKDIDVLHKHAVFAAFGGVK